MESLGGGFYPPPFLRFVSLQGSHTHISEKENNRAKKSNVTVMAEKLYTIAENDSIEATAAQFGFKRPGKEEEDTEAGKSQQKKYDSACAALKHHFRAYAQRMNTNGILDQSILTTIGVLSDE